MLKNNSFIKILISLFMFFSFLLSAAEIEGTVEQDEIVTVEGSFEPVFNGDIAHEYFDDRTGELTSTTDGAAMSNENGGIVLEALGNDLDNATAGGNFHQLEHLGWLAKICSGAGCFTTGYG